MIATELTFKLGGNRVIQRLGFGAMRLTGPGIWGEPADHEGAKRVLKRVLELGVDFIDTADSYGPEVSERLIGEALFPYPKGLVVATKAGLTRGGPGQWSPNGKPAHLKEACAGSLKRLRVERLDLLQLHRPDPEVPFEDSVGALAELRHEGKVDMVGLSNVTVDELHRAQRIVPIVSVQNRYSIGDRASEDVLAECQRQGIAFIPWFPLAAGQADRAEKLQRTARAVDATPFQVALAWLLQHSPVMVPIPGTSSIRHLEENMASLRLSLDPAQVRELSAA
jgi:aryl-alcohol dehydrogenase-like predicted oxidoreductase